MDEERKDIIEKAMGYENIFAFAWTTGENEDDPPKDMFYCNAPSTTSPDALYVLSSGAYHFLKSISEQEGLSMVELTALLMSSIMQRDAGAEPTTEPTS